MTNSKASSKLTTSPPDICYLLRLPPEVRCVIYRLLFIPQPAHYFLDPEIPNRRENVEWWLPETHKDKVQNQLHISIFRTNGRINAEATSLLYRELTLVVCPADITHHRSPPSRLAIRPSTSYPYHVTIFHVARTDIHHQATTWQNVPHIFARFHNINLNFSLTYPLGPVLCGLFEGFSFDRSAQIPSEEVESFDSETCSTELIRDSVTLLSHSRNISVLWITLDIVAWATHVRHAGEEMKHLLQTMANMKAAEIWLECGVLDPLKELTNVECAILNVRCPTEDCFATLQPEYAAIVEQLEEDIESGASMD